MKLGDVFKLSSGKSLPEKKRTPGNHNVYGGNGITGNHNDYFVEKPTIVIGRVGEYCGAVHLTTEKCWITDNALMVTEWYQGIDKQYLVYALNAMNLHQYAKTVGQPSISQANVYSLDINLPLMEQQQEIVKILNLVSKIIIDRKKEITRLDELIKARFVELFGNPEQNEKGWKTCRLGDECTVINGRAYKAEELLDEGKYRVLRVGNFFTNDSWYYSDLELDKDKYCDNGDLLFAWSASFGPRIWHGEKVIYHYHIWKLIGYEECLNKDFFVELLNYNCDVMKRGTHGSTMLHFTKSQMEDQKLILPPMEMQEQFADFVHQVDKSKFKEIATTNIYCFNYMMSS